MGSLKRMSALDLSAVVQDITQQVVGMKLSNIYSMSKRAFLMKFSGKDRKAFLLIESGLRVHLTEFEHETDSAPNGFVMKLRKHIKNKRLNKVEQLGFDRVIHLQFGAGENAYSVFVEVYGTGNVLLTDSNRSILALLRQQSYGQAPLGASAEDGEANIAQIAAMRATYPVVGAQLPDMANATWVRSVLESKAARDAQKQLPSSQEGTVGKSKRRGKKSHTSHATVTAALSESVLGPQLALHAMAHVSGGDRDYVSALEDEDYLAEVAKGVEVALAVVDKVQHGEARGLVKAVVKHDDDRRMGDDKVEEATESNSYIELTDFSPFPFSQLGISASESEIVKIAHDQSISVEKTTWLEFDTFSHALDRYYNSKEDERERARVSRDKAAVMSKVAKVQDEHTQRLMSLRKQIAETRLQAQLVEASCGAVDMALKAVKSQVMKGLEWPRIEAIIEEQKKLVNPVALLLERLDLGKDEVVVGLSWDLAHVQMKVMKLMMERDRLRRAVAEQDQDEEEEEEEEEQEAEEAREEDEEEEEALRVVDDVNAEGEDDEEEDEDSDTGSHLRHNGDEEEEEEEEETPRVLTQAEEEALLLGKHVGDTHHPVSVRLKLSLSAHGNAAALYKEVKTLEYKLHMTEEMGMKMVKQAIKKGERELFKVKESSVRARRKPWWFEKFHWFISSEDYLVVAGKDAAQNEMLVRRYMGKDDVYAHADIHGAASVVVKNKPNGGAIPELTLQQACTFAAANSKAWSNRGAGTRTWWVHSSQVSKVAPTGMYLGQGSFMIRGEKNVVNVNTIVMGIGVLFKLGDAESVARHKGERYVRGSIEDEDREDKQDREESAEGAREASVDVDESVSLPTFTQDGEVADVAEDNEDNTDNNDDGYDGEVDIGSAADREEEEEREEEEKHLKRAYIDNRDDNNNNPDDNLDDNNKGGLSRKDRREMKKLKMTVEQYREYLKKSEAGKPVQQKSEISDYPEDDEDIGICGGKKDAKKQAGGAKGGKGGKKQEVPKPAPAPARTEGKKKGKKGRFAVELDEEDRAALQEKYGFGRRRELLAEQEKQREEQARREEEEKERRMREKEEWELSQRSREGKESKDEGDEEEEESVQLDYDILDNLTSVPVLEDLITHAIPMVGPYAAMNTFAYKLKLIPGGGKKGALVKEVVAMLNKQSSSVASVQKFIKQISDQELNLVLPSSAKVSAPGLQKVQKEIKKEKKLAAKEKEKKKG